MIIVIIVLLLLLLLLIKFLQCHVVLTSATLE